VFELLITLTAMYVMYLLAITYLIRDIKDLEEDLIEGENRTLHS